MSNQVLLIEDDQTVRENTAEILELSGYEVFIASDGKKGVDKAKEILPDIIVCDVMMPEMDGYDVLSNLAENDATYNIPFIFLSAKTDHKDVRKGMDLGADDYLTKPFEEEDLINAIESRLAKTAILKKRHDDEKESHQINGFSLEVFKDKLKTYPVVELKSGSNVYMPGDTANKFYLIKRGVIKTHQVDDKGKELTTDLYKADEFFGSLIFNKNYNYNEFATALEDSVLYVAPKDDVKNLLATNPTILFEIIDLLGENLSETKEQLIDMAYSSVQRKTAQTILLFAERLKKNKLRQIRISRSDLASVAGIASESLIRTLSKFKKQGIIDIEGRNIKINDFEALEEIK
ncbi:MAG: response regulator [Bacteroidota bacterium]